MKTIKIGEIFDVVKGKSSYTKSYGMAHNGEYPVFSASNTAPLTFIDNFDFDGKYITWATNGFAGYIKIIEGKFNINGDRGVLVPKYENIDIEYIKYLLEPILRGLAKGRKGDNAENEFTKVYPRMVESVEIQIPIKEDGEFDLQTQQEIASQYILIDEFKNKIKEYQERIKKLQVKIENMGSINIFNLVDVFNTSAGRSEYTKGYVEKNKGQYPIYSANTTDGGLFGYINTFDFDDECIQITTNGAKAGTIFYRPLHQFSINGDAKVLTRKNNNIDYKYSLYELQRIFKEQKFSRENKPTQAKIKELQITFPVMSDGSFDLLKQQEIAEIYDSIAYVKLQISEKLQTLQDLQIAIQTNKNLPSSKFFVLFS